MAGGDDAAGDLGDRPDAGRDADRDAALDEVRDLPAVAAVTDVRAVWMMIEQYLGLFYLIVGLMLAFGGVLAVALIYNVVSVNLAERTGELATMRANGVSHRRIGAYVMAENMILTAFGVIPGASSRTQQHPG